MEATATLAEDDTAEFILIINTLTTLLTLMLVTVAALGVLNMVVLETRERVHDLGVHKALGMTPRQTIAMVIASVVVTGLIGGAIGAPVGVMLQRMIIDEMGRSTGFTLPASVINIYQPAELVLFGLGGLAHRRPRRAPARRLGGPHPHRHRTAHRVTIGGCSTGPGEECGRCYTRARALSSSANHRAGISVWGQPPMSSAPSPASVSQAPIAPGQHYVPQLNATLRASGWYARSPRADCLYGQRLRHR